MTMSDTKPLAIGDKSIAHTEAAVEKQSPASLTSGELSARFDSRAPQALASSTPFHRYHIETETVPDIAPHPSRFRVKVKKHRLIGMVLKEIVALKGDLPVAMSRPCVYGVFSRPVGGLAPREELCVGCLRCTVQYPGIVQIIPNPARQRLGDSSMKPDYIDTILYEARTGRVPVRGAGYRGKFGGEGWDGLWTDMSEIVRPTRDGIHGREYISTVVEIGEKPAFLRFDEQGELAGPLPRSITTQVPFLFDMPVNPGRSGPLAWILAETARQVETLAMLPIAAAVELFSQEKCNEHIVPVVAAESWHLLDKLPEKPEMIVLEGWDREHFEELRQRFPDAIVCVRVPMDANILELVQQGVRVFHLTANFHGYVGDRFVMDLILRAHKELVEAGVREQVTLIGGGGMILAEHVPKAIICGLDAVTLDVALAVALQARFNGECLDRETASLAFPRLDPDWGVRRLKNLSASWHDQLLEILGAMGLREVRRLRGEPGRCMFQRDLEEEVFGEIMADEPGEDAR
jgi:hypothetical protein